MVSVASPDFVHKIEDPRYRLAISGLPSFLGNQVLKNQ